VAAAVTADGGPVGLDTETTGLDHSRDRVRLLQLATPRSTFLIDVFAVGPAALAPVFEALARAEVVGHNLGFDLPFLMRLGFTPGRVVDTMLASQVLHAGDLAARHGLRDVAARHLGLTLEKELQQADWAGPLTRDMLAYAALDAEVPLRAWPELAAGLEAARLTAVAEVEFAALPCVAWTACRGVALDRQAWQALAAATRTPSGRGCGRRSTPRPRTAPPCSAPATGTARMT
jgi:ribonuclease D